MNQFEECPAKGDKCESCLLLARNACAQAMQDVDPSLTSVGITMLVEDAKLPAMIENTSGVSALGCASRRERAEKIGRKLGVTLANKREL